MAIATALDGTKKLRCVTMELRDFRRSALARYHDAALETAVVLLALARYPLHSHFDQRFQSITNVRSHVRIMSEMHSFCQNSRKAIEIANLIDNTIKPFTYSIKMLRAGESRMIAGNVVKINDQNFMWIIGRIIHSVCVMVCSETKQLEMTQGRLYSEERNKYFLVGSDNDGASAYDAAYVVLTEQTHYINIEDFVACYTDQLTIKIENAIKALRPL